MFNFYKNHKFLSVFFSVISSFLFLAVATYAATTISTSITTGGSLTVDGNSTFGNAATDVNLFTGTLQASTTALFTSGFTTYGDLTINKAATTTVTFSQAGINFGSDTLVIDPNATRVGVGSSSPFSALGVTGTTTSSLGMKIGQAGSGISQFLFGTCAVNFGNTSASTSAAVNCTATGVTTDFKVFVTPNDLPHFFIYTGASTTADNTIQIGGFNGNGASVDPASRTWSWMGVR